MHHRIGADGDPAVVLERQLTVDPQGNEGEALLAVDDNHLPCCASYDCRKGNHHYQDEDRTESLLSSPLRAKDEPPSDEADTLMRNITHLL